MLGDMLRACANRRKDDWIRGCPCTVLVAS